MKYLVTGSEGFIGRNLISYMEKNKISYCTLFDSHWYKYVDTIIHLSANTDVRRSITNPGMNFKRNTEKTFRYLKKARKYNILNFIFASSMGVVDPRSPYLASKVSGEAYCKAFKESYGLNTHIARFSNVYGPCSEFKNSIISKFIKSIILDRTFYIYGDGEQTRDFIHVNDIVRSLLNTSGDISYNTSGTVTSISELVRELTFLSNELLNKDPKISYKPSSPGEIETVRETKGVPSPTLLKTGLKETFKWFIEYL